MSEKITGLHDLRPGDLMFGPLGIANIGQLILGEQFRIGPFAAGHVGVVIEAGTPATGPRLVQAMPGGAEEIELTDRHWSPKYVYARLPEDYPGQAEDAAAIAQLFVSERVPYSFASYAALAAWRFGVKAEWLARWIDRRRPATYATGDLQLPAEAICSVLADQAWTLAGKEVVTGTRSQIVTPGMLAMQLWRRPGVVWGGAGLLESS
jgi:hypothetical protein